MVDIKKHPYFSYNQQVDRLMEPLKAYTEIDMIGFGRMYQDRQRFLICHHHDWATDFYENELYRHGLYEKLPKDLPSAYHMWDHLPYSPPEVYVRTRNKFGLAHGLTIIKQYKDYSDSFVFATTSNNGVINNFYLNEKVLFETYISSFYTKFETELIDLERHLFCIPAQIMRTTRNSLKLTQRQTDCAVLIAKGLNTKEVAKALNLSPRTVEAHIDKLREKFAAKNRIQLLYLLNQHSQVP